MNKTLKKNTKKKNDFDENSELFKNIKNDFDENSELFNSDVEISKNSSGDSDIFIVKGGLTKKSLKKKIPKNKTSRKKTLKHKTPKNKTLKNKTSKNRTSKNRTSKNRTSKNKTSKNKILKNNSSRKKSSTKKLSKKISDNELSNDDLLKNKKITTIEKKIDSHKKSHILEKNKIPKHFLESYIHSDSDEDINSHRNASDVEIYVNNLNDILNNEIIQRKQSTNILDNNIRILDNNVRGINEKLKNYPNINDIREMENKIIKKNENDILEIKKKIEYIEKIINKN